MKKVIKYIFQNYLSTIVCAVMFAFMTVQTTSLHRKVDKIANQETKSVEKVAEVQCTVELNIKNNKNGVVVLDANQTASKLGEQVKQALKENK